MHDIFIYVEGKDDFLFLRIVLQKLGLEVLSIKNKNRDKNYKVTEKETNIYIHILDGYDNVRKCGPRLDMHDKKEEKYFFILDADTGGHENGGVVERRKFLFEISENRINENNLFLIPNNNDDGNLETLLKHIIRNPYNCLNQYYSTFVQQLDDSKLFSHVSRLENDKYKMYTYRNLYEEDMQVPCYCNDFWDFDNPYIAELNNFLKVNVVSVMIKDAVVL